MCITMKRFFIQLLAKAVSRGGNLLLNIGPKGDGIFDSREEAILAGITSWTKKNGESIYHASKTMLSLQSWGVTTLGKDKLYLHVFNWLSNGRLYLGELLNKTGDHYSQKIHPGHLVIRQYKRLN
ncbi:alpha-L-fucosidase [Pedobacter sp. PAMC26386]|nr:alpha-L-fucosidase [Pedobacter sp. PAMC26386]